MSQCYSCTTCSSADKELEKFIDTLPVETAFHRAKSQESKCSFGLQGICCRLCANGPCRTTPSNPRGVCGSTADTIVARNFLRTVAIGSGCYIHVIERTARNLKDIALAKRTLNGLGALYRLCDMFGIEGSDTNDKAVKLADTILDDLYKPEFVEMTLIKKIAHPQRYKVWKELGILPGGAKSEVFVGSVKSSTNLNSDPVDMLLHCLRLGVSTGLYGLMLTSLLNDVIMGEAQIHIGPVGFRVISADYINIMLTGHQQSKFAYLQEHLMQADIMRKAELAGAKGFKLIGCTCVGQEFQLRGAHRTGVFDGHAGNNFTSEVVLATGAIDAVLSEFNCTLPGIEPICDKLQIKQICIDGIAKKANAELHEFTFETQAIVTNMIVDEVIAAYKLRRGSVPINLLPNHGNENTIGGISEISLKCYMGGTWTPLVQLIASGRIKGLAAVVGCSNLTDGHDVLTVNLTKALIAKDIMVLAAGCSSGGLENCGLMTPEAAELAGPNLKSICKQAGIPPVLNFGPCLAIGRLELVASELAEILGVDIPALPMVLSAPQWLEEQALADGLFGLALGLTLHLGTPPFVTGSEVALKVLFEDMKTLTGGSVVINSDAAQSAVILEDIIMQKRKALKLP